MLLYNLMPTELVGFVPKWASQYPCKFATVVLGWSWWSDTFVSYFRRLCLHCHVPFQVFSAILYISSEMNTKIFPSETTNFCWPVAPIVWFLVSFRHQVLMSARMKCHCGPSRILSFDLYYCTSLPVARNDTFHICPNLRCFVPSLESLDPTP